MKIWRTNNQLRLCQRLWDGIFSNTVQVKHSLQTTWSRKFQWPLSLPQGQNRQFCPIHGARTPKQLCLPLAVVINSWRLSPSGAHIHYSAKETRHVFSLEKLYLNWTNFLRINTSLETTFNFLMVSVNCFDFDKELRTGTPPKSKITAHENQANKFAKIQDWRK